MAQLTSKMFFVVIHGGIATIAALYMNHSLPDISQRKKKKGCSWGDRTVPVDSCFHKYNMLLKSLSGAQLF